MGCRSSTTVNSTVAAQERKRDFSLIDKHARKTPKKVESSFESLAEYLISPAKDDIDKARAFYVWVCEKIRQFNDESSILAMMSKVCLAVGCRHARQKMFLKRENPYAKDLLMYITNYVMSPEHFIKAHIPYMDDDEVESRKWQLLEHPITIEQFSKAAKPEQEAMEWNLEFPDTPFQVIECTCLFDFRIYFKKNCLKRVQAALYNTSGYPQHNAVTTTHHGSYIAVHVQPKNEGEYMLRIFGNINNSNHLPMLMEYMVRYACP